MHSAFLIFLKNFYLIFYSQWKTHKPTHIIKKKLTTTYFNNFTIKRNIQNNSTTPNLFLSYPLWVWAPTSSIDNTFKCAKLQRKRWASSASCLLLSSFIIGNALDPRLGSWIFLNSKFVCWMILFRNGGRSRGFD